MNLPRKQAGLSLIELMVAILISSLLLLGVLELYLNSSRADRTSNQLARIQENGRLVMELISREASCFQGGVGSCPTNTENSREASILHSGVCTPPMWIENSREMTSCMSVGGACA